MKLPNDTPSTRPGVLRPIAATSVQTSMPPDLKIPSVNCTGGSKHSWHLQKLDITSSLPLVLIRPLIFITGMSTSPSSRSRLFSHQSVVTDIISDQTTRESLTSHRLDVQCLTEDLEKEFLGEIHSMGLQMIDLVSLDIRNHTWILSPVAARGIRNPSVRS